MVLLIRRSVTNGRAASCTRTTSALGRTAPKPFATDSCRRAPPSAIIALTNMGKPRIIVRLRPLEGCGRRYHLRGFFETSTFDSAFEASNFDLRALRSPPEVSSAVFEFFAPSNKTRGYAAELATTSRTEDANSRTASRGTLAVSIG